MGLGMGGKKGGGGLVWFGWESLEYLSIYRAEEGLRRLVVKNLLLVSLLLYIFLKGLTIEERKLC